MTNSPVGEEAARLLTAAQEWLAGRLGETPPAGGEGDCHLCPICRGLAAVRSARPDVVAHLAEASASLLAALASAIEPHRHPGAAPPAPGPRGEGPPPSPPAFERIEVTG